MHVVLSLTRRKKTAWTLDGLKWQRRYQRNLLVKVVTASKDKLAHIIAEENVDVAHHLTSTTLI